MLAQPSLTSHAVRISRPINGTDIEGKPLRTYTVVADIRGGFGSTNSAAEIVAGTASQRVDAAISTLSRIEILPGDKARVAGREWVVLAVQQTALTSRILLAAWGS